jgi:hypothetical protein
MLPTSGHSGDRLRRVVAVGASAGGVKAFTNFASSLPADLPVENLWSGVMELHARLDLENRIAMGSKFSLEFGGNSLGQHSGNICDCGGSRATTRSSTRRRSLAAACRGLPVRRVNGDE